MDNFILYDEISKGTNSIIYKGRRKGSINFLAIHCIEKVMRPEITNLVRLTYEIAHKNIVKFYEWYETSNHLWLVVELCTGGALDAIIKQDACLPESSIKQFGVDICEGLFYIHSLGIMFCDLHPKKLMIDGNGTLKLSDFGLSKLEGETLEEIFQETTADASYKPATSVVSPISNKLLFGDPNYLAPEILNGEEHSKASDLWGLGCIMYEMYTGHAPFASDNIEQLVEKVTIKDLPNPKGNKLSTKPSSEFLSLLKGLLEKDVAKRLSWKQVVRHPFWEGKLIHLIPITTKSIMIDGKETFTDEQEDDVIDRHRLSTDRPKTSAGLNDQKPEMNVSFSMSSRLPVSPQSTIHTRNPLQCQESDETSNQQQQQQSNSASYSNNNNPNFKEYRKLFFINSESNTSQIIDNTRIQKPASLKYEPKSIPITNNKLLKAESLLQVPRDDFYKHLDYIKSNTIVSNDKSALTIKSKLQLMNYIGCLCSESSQMADEFVAIELYKDLVLMVKSGHNLEMKMKAARILAIMFSKATKLDAKRELSDVLQTLIDIISANRKDVKLKQALLPTLGELLYIISSQESMIGKPVEAWAVPQLAYLLIIRSIGEDLTVNHIVCKIVEKIASTNSVHVQKFIALQADLVNSLWSCYAHSSNNEQLRVTVLNAFCQLTSHSVTIFQSLIDKIGVDTMLDTLSLTNTRIQQATLTMLSMYINECNLKSIPEKKLISKITPIYDCTNLNCRSKVYLLTYILLKQQNDLLIQFTNTKLINSIERDFRKTFNSKEENEYIHKILGYLVSIIINICTANMDELISTLDSVNGRKNPSSLQTKQLKRVIPNALTLKLLFASQTFRSRLLDETFVQKYGKILHLSKFLVGGELNLDSICGASATFDYMAALTSLLEVIGQSKEILQAYSRPILEFIVPTLIENIDATNSDLSVESLRTLSEICCRLFHDQEVNVNQDLKKQFKTFIENFFVEKLDKLLAQPEPLPYFALIIVESVFNHDLMFVNALRAKHILPPIFKLMIAYKNKISSALTQKILNVITLWSSLNDPSDLYENGIIDCLRALFVESQKMRKIDEKSSLGAVTEILKILDNLLKYVSEFVKKALQAKKVAGSGDSLAQQAERLLHSNKPLIGICPYLISLLVNDDNDIAELACKVLWVIMQLFGGECKDLLNPDNLIIFTQAITTSNFKRQKILLRVVKRIITADKGNLEVFKTIGHSFMDNMKILKNQASAEANVTLSSLIDEILKLV